VSMLNQSAASMPQARKRLLRLSSAPGGTMGPHRVHGQTLATDETSYRAPGGPRRGRRAGHAVRLRPGVRISYATKNEDLEEACGQSSASAAI